MAGNGAKRDATLTDGNPNRHDDGGMRTWSLSFVRGAVVLALSAALLAATAPAGAQTYDEERDDARARAETLQQEAQEDLRARAEQGDADAQAEMGRRCDSGYRRSHP